MHEWVRDFRPDLVYSVLGGVWMMRLAVEVATRSGRPLVPHFMDDWPSTMYTDRELFGLARRRVGTGLREVLGVAPMGLAISEQMADEYQTRYARPFAPFGNSVDESAFTRRPVEPASAPDGLPGLPVRLVYLGGLHLNRWRPLVDIASALTAVDPDARLVVHAPDADLQTFGGVLAGCAGIRLAGPVTSDQVPRVLAGADILVHIESFDPADRRFTRLSLSTKIPQYMAAGRPILGYGPAEVASIRHIETARSGLVVGRRSPGALTAAVSRLVTDSALRDELGGNGYRFAVRHHARQQVTDRLISVLRCAAGWGNEPSATIGSPDPGHGEPS